MSKWSSERTIHEMLQEASLAQAPADSGAPAQLQLQLGGSGSTTTTTTTTTTSRVPPADTAQHISVPPLSHHSDVSVGAVARPAAGVGGAGGAGVWEGVLVGRQALLEAVGRAARTPADPALEAGVQRVQAARARLSRLHEHAAALQRLHAAAPHHHRALADTLAELAAHEHEHDGHGQLQLQHEYRRAAQGALYCAAQHDKLAHHLHAVADALRTLTDTSMRDTLDTARRTERARLAMDAGRARAVEGQAAREAAWRALRDALAAKLQLVREHEARTMRRHLAHLHHALHHHHRLPPAPAPAPTPSPHPPPPPPSV